MEEKDNSSSEADPQGNSGGTVPEGLDKPKTSPEELASAGRNILNLPVGHQNLNGDSAEKLQEAREMARQAIADKIAYCLKHKGQLSDANGKCSSADVCSAIKKFRDLDRLPAAVDILASKILIPDRELQTPEWEVFVGNDAGLLAQHLNVPIGAVFLRDKINKAPQN